MAGEKTDSGRLTAAVWAAMLAPGVGVLPGLCAEKAGTGGWLTPLAVLPAFVLMRKLLARVSGGGLGRRFWKLGGVWGRVLTIIYIMWALLLGSARLRMSGQRLVFTGRQETGLWLFLIVLAAAAGWLAREGEAVFVRTAAVFFGVLTFSLTGMVLLTAAQIRPENLLLLWVEDIPGVLRGSVYALGVLGCGVYGTFFDSGSDAGGTGKAVGCCVLLSALLASVFGNMGVELTGKLADPFITLSKYVGVEGAFQRVESLTAALWLFGDLALLGLLLSACSRMIEAAAPDRNGKWVTAVGAAAMLLGGGTLFRDAVLAREFEYEVAPLGNLVLGVVVPGLLLLLDRGERGGTSCAGSGKKRQI